MVSEVLLDLLKLVETHAAVVDTNRDEAVADGLAHQGRSHRAVDTAADASDDEGLGTDEFPDTGDLELDKVAHLPVGLGSADVDAEVAQDLSTARGLFLRVSRANIVVKDSRRGTNVFELRVELDTLCVLSVYYHGRPER